MHNRTHDGQAFRMLNVLAKFTRESLSIRVRRKLFSADVAILESGFEIEEVHTLFSEFGQDAPPDGPRTCGAWPRTSLVGTIELHPLG